MYENRKAILFDRRACELNLSNDNFTEEANKEGITSPRK